MLLEFHIGALTLRPRACRQMTTLWRFCCSQRSTVWKSSSEVTPRVLAAARKLLMFSMHLKAILLCWIFLTEPAWIWFTRLEGHRAHISHTVADFGCRTPVDLSSRYVCIFVSRARESRPLAIGRRHRSLILNLYAESVILLLANL